MPQHPITKPATVDYFKVPRRLWRLVKKHLPAEAAPGPSGGRRRIGNRAVLNGIWYVMWTGCQWKVVHRTWFGASSSVLHERFQTWQTQGVWERVFAALVRFYRRERGIQWRWQAVDSRSCAAPLGGSETGKNPTDRAKLVSRSISWSISGARRWPLTSVAPTNTTNGRFTTWSCMWPSKRPTSQQHFCGDKGYDFDDVRQTVAQAGDVPHIKRKRGAVSCWPMTIPSPARRNIPHAAG